MNRLADAFVGGWEVPAFLAQLLDGRSRSE